MDSTGINKASCRPHRRINLGLLAAFQSFWGLYLTYHLKSKLIIMLHQLSLLVRFKYENNIYVHYICLPLFVERSPLDFLASSSKGIVVSAALVLLPSVISLLASSFTSLLTDLIDLADLAKNGYHFTIIGNDNDSKFF